MHFLVFVSGKVKSLIDGLDSIIQIRLFLS